MPITKIATSSIELQYENYINILRTGQSVADTGWRTYLNTAGVNPTTGIGGTTGITWTQNNIDPLNSEADLRLVKDANNRQGEGVSIDFTIDNRHLAKVLQISFDTELISGNYESPILTSTTGTYSITSTTCTVTANHSFIQGQVVNMTFTSGSPPVNGFYTITSVTATTFVFTVASGSSTGNCSYTVPADLRVSIIQDPFGTPVVLEPVNTGISLGISNPRQRIRHIASFQTHLSLKTYRLCIHVSNASTVAYTVDFANFKVWEPTQSVGAVITDWQSYTPTLGGFTSITNLDFQWRRVGSNMEIQGKWTNGANDSTEARIPLPFGTIDSSRVPSIRIVGNGGYNASASTYFGTYILAEPNVSYLTMGIQASTLNAISKITANIPGNNTYTMFASVPLSGWGSNVAMSSDTGDGRVVALYIQGNLTSSISGDGIITWTSLTTNQDTHGAFNFSTGIYTAPISGYYNISGHFNTNASINTVIRAWVNGVSKIGYLGVSPSSGMINISGGVFLNAGEQLTIRPNQAYSAVSGGSFLFINRISAGSQIIASSERVHCRYTNTNGQSITAATNTLLQYNNRIEDSHGAYSTSDWIYRPPMSGIYLFTVGIAPASNSSNGWASYLFINKSSISSLADGIQVNPFYNNSGGNGGSNGSIAVRLNASDTVRIITNYSNSGTSPITLYNNGEYGSTLTVTRISI